MHPALSKIMNTPSRCQTRTFVLNLAESGLGGCVPHARARSPRHRHRPKPKAKAGRQRQTRHVSIPLPAPAARPALFALAPMVLHPPVCTINSCSCSCIFVVRGAPCCAVTPLTLQCAAVSPAWSRATPNMAGGLNPGPEKSQKKLALSRPTTCRFPTSHHPRPHGPPAVPHCPSAALQFPPLLPWLLALVAVNNDARAFLRGPFRRKPTHHCCPQSPSTAAHPCPWSPFTVAGHPRQCQSFISMDVPGLAHPWSCPKTGCVRL